uniref:FLYWCH-type domain-containing protein n=1 Tax=Meloidogyne enterolobii TaxID=390850 RepID=A0A6V7WWA9_MELEN|nr:unnamed protein product [Meloidogyne enterolobii]
MASFVDSQKGGKKLIYEGHLYQKHFERGQDIYWRCDLYKSTHCSGRAKTRSLEENTAVELGNQHNHAPSPARCEAWKINRAVRATAISSFGNAPRTVTNECLAGASDAVISALPDISSMEKAVCRTRQKHGGHLEIPQTLHDINIPQV